MNGWKKEIKVTFVGFGLHAGRFAVEYKEYGNTLFLYFDIFIYVSSNFTLDSRSTECFQCHIGLQLHTCFINFDLVSFHCAKMKFSIKDFFSKCDQIGSFLRISSQLLKKSLMENFVSCTVFAKTE